MTDIFHLGFFITIVIIYMRVYHIACLPYSRRPVYSRIPAGGSFDSTSPRHIELDQNNLNRGGDVRQNEMQKETMHGIGLMGLPVRENDQGRIQNTIPPPTCHRVSSGPQLQSERQEDSEVSPRVCVYHYPHDTCQGNVDIIP